MPGNYGEWVLGVSVRGLEQVQRLFTTITAGSKQAAQATSRATKEVTGGTELVMRRAAKWAAAGTIIFGVVQSLKSASREFERMDYIMTQIAKVMGDTAPLEQMRDEAYRLGKAIGRSSTEIAQAMFTWAQQGLKVNQVLELTRAQVLAMASAGLNAQEAVDSLTAYFRVFGAEAERASEVVDKWMAVQARFAITASELALGMRILASTVRAFGGDVDEINAILAATAEASRSTGHQIANAFKLIISRLSTPQAQQAIQRIAGVAVFKAGGTEYRRLTSILRDLAQWWEKAGTAERIRLAYLVAGARRIREFTALMTNWKRAEEALQVSTLAFGEANRAAQREMMSWRAIIRGITESYKELGRSLSEYLLIPISNIIRTVGQLTAAFIKSTGSTGKFLATLLALKGVLMFIRRTFVYEVAQISKMSDVWNRAATSVGIASNAYRELAANMQLASVSAKTLYTTLPKTPETGPAVTPFVPLVYMRNIRQTRNEVAGLTTSLEHLTGIFKRETHARRFATALALVGTAAKSAIKGLAIFFRQLIPLTVFMIAVEAISSLINHFRKARREQKELVEQARPLWKAYYDMVSQSMKATSVAFGEYVGQMRKAGDMSRYFLENIDWSKLKTTDDAVRSLKNLGLTIDSTAVATEKLNTIIKFLLTQIPGKYGISVKEALNEFNDFRIGILQGTSEMGKQLKKMEEAFRRGEIAKPLEGKWAAVNEALMREMKKTMNTTELFLQLQEDMADVSVTSGERATRAIYNTIGGFEQLLRRAKPEQIRKALIEVFTTTLGKKAQVDIGVNVTPATEGIQKLKEVLNSPEFTEEIAVRFAPKGFEDAFREIIRVAAGLKDTGEILNDVISSANMAKIMFAQMVDPIDKLTGQLRVQLQVANKLAEVYRDVGLSYDNLGATISALKSHVADIVKLHYSSAESVRLLGEQLKKIGQMDVSSVDKIVESLSKLGTSTGVRELNSALESMTKDTGKMAESFLKALNNMQAKLFTSLISAAGTKQMSDFKRKVTQYYREIGVLIQKIIRDPNVDIEGTLDDVLKTLMRIVREAQRVRFETIELPRVKGQALVDIARERYSLEQSLLRTIYGETVPLEESLRALNRYYAQRKASLDLQLQAGAISEAEYNNQLMLLEIDKRRARANLEINKAFEMRRRLVEPMARLIDGIVSSLRSYLVNIRTILYEAGAGIGNLTKSLARSGSEMIVTILTQPLEAKMRELFGSAVSPIVFAHTQGASAIKQAIIDASWTGSQMYYKAITGASMGGELGMEKPVVSTAELQGKLNQMFYRSMSAFAGILIGGRMGGPETYSAEGAQIGALAGMVLPQLVSMAPALAIALPAMLAIAGGAIGSMFGRSPIQENTETLRENTMELVRNTNALQDLRNMLINAPARFTIPPLGGMSGYGGVAYQINVNIPEGTVNAEHIKRVTESAVEEVLNKHLSYMGREVRKF